jgi:hypothetical protein
MPLIPVTLVQARQDPAVTSPPIAGYAAHYDPSDSSTVTLTNGLIVTSVTDKSGGGFTLTGTGNILYGIPSSSQTNRKMLFFNENSQGLTSGMDVSDRTATNFIVGFLTSITNSTAFTLLGSNNDGGNEFRVSQTTGQLATLATDVVLLATQSNAAVTAGVPFCAAQVLTATDITHYLGTVSETDANATAFTAARTLSVARCPTVAEADRHQFRGGIGEIIMYSTTLATNDVVSTIAYLMDKWRVS